MSNIFDFPPDRQSKVSPGFLNDSADLVRFDDLGRTFWPAEQEDEAPKAPAPVTDPETLHRLDWSNQELASIYRVRSLLEAAGVSTVVDRGVSDEGEPWCVLCRNDDEVFIHLCRIDGLYLLDSPNLQRPLLGRSFAELVDAFSQGALAAREEERETAPRCRVVRFDRNDNVMLHPATMLAALIWTILLQSEDLLLVQVDEADGAAFADRLAALSDPDALHTPSVESADAEIAALDDAETGLRPEDAPITEAAAAGSREPITKILLSAPLTGVAAGLSTIAIACGFMSEALHDDEGRLSLTALGLGGSSEGEEAEADDTVVADDADGEGALESLAAMISSLARPFHGEDAAGAPEAEHTADADGVPNLGHLPDPFAASILSEAEIVPEEPSADAEMAEAGATIDLQMASAAGRVPDVIDVSSGGGDQGAVDFSDLHSISEIRDFLFADLRPIVIDGASLLASFDISLVDEEDTMVIDAALAMVGGGEVAQYQSGPATASPGLSGEAPTSGGAGASKVAPGAAAQGQSEVTISTAKADAPETVYASRVAPANPYVRDGGLPEFDAEAREFFFYMRSKRDVESIVSKTDIVLMDLSAPGDEVVMMTWELSHGGTVSIVGAYDDYMAYDLIA